MPSTNRVSVLLLLCLFFLSLLPYFTKYDLSTVWTAVVGVTEFLGWLSGKESACSAGDAGEMGSAPGSGRSPGGGHGNTLQYSYLKNPMDRGPWWVTVHRVARSVTRLK